MKFIRLLLFLACSLTAFGQSVIFSSYAMTNNPSDGHTFTENGTTTTFKTSVTSSATQIAIGASISDTMANLETHMGENAISGLSFVRSASGTNFLFFGNAGAAHTASISGAWGALTLTTNANTFVSFGVPQSAISNSLVRETNVNNLIASLQYGTAQIPTTYPAFTNFMTRATAQDVTGQKTFSTAIVTNFYARGPLTLSNGVSANSITFSVLPLEPANTSRALMSASGEGISFIFLSDSGGIQNTAAKFFRTSAAASGISFYAPVTIENGGLTNSLFTGGTITNTAGGFTSLWATGAFNGAAANLSGNLGITNNAVTLTLYDSGGTTDDKLTKIVADGDALEFRFYNDAGSLVNTPLSIQRVDGVGSFVFDGGISLLSGGIIVEDDLEGHGDIFTSGVITAGEASSGAPASLTGGFVAADATEPSADPTSAAVLYSSSGAWKYRVSGSGEGSGGTFYLHNRGAMTQGTGTDYSLTSSTAAVDFGTTDPKITAPTSGTYTIYVCISITAGANVNDSYRCKLRNTTTASDITGSDHEITHLGIGEMGEINFAVPNVALSASDVVELYAHNNTGARGTVNSARTRISYVRQY